jgi:pyrroline-5-carboxylate reductase
MATALSDPIVVIGGGNMGGALAMRWRSTVASTAGVHLIEPDEKVRARFAGTGIITYQSISEFNITRGVLVVAVKPQTFEELAPQLTQILARGNATMVSVMAGVSLAELEKVSARCVRLMPNTPAQIGEGMAVACNPKLEAGSRYLVNKLFEYTGRIVWVEDESLIHAATAVSGSGPAYIFAFMEAFERAARGVGFPAPMARQLVVQTILGAAQLASQSLEDPIVLRRNVTSPKGTTEAALNVLLAAGVFPKLIDDTVKAAHRRSQEIAGEL